MATAHPNKAVAGLPLGEDPAGPIVSGARGRTNLIAQLVTRMGRERWTLWGLDGRSAAAALIAAVGTALFVFPIAPPVDETAIHGGAMLLVFLGLWLIGALPDYLAAILFFGAVPALGLAPPEIVFSGFRAGAVWLILGGFVIGGAIEATGLGARAANRIVGALGRSYPALVTGAVLVSAVMVFLAPSSIARVFMLLPIVNALSERVGFEPGGNGHCGLVLSATLSSLILSYQVLPSAAPNLVMLGTAEHVFGFHVDYGEYLLINYPVLAVFTIIALPVLICRLLPAETRRDAAPPPTGPVTRNERVLAVILAMALALWLTDFVHGVSAAWVSLAAAALCLAPGFGPARQVPLAKSVNFPLWLFIAAVIGAGAVVHHSGFGDLVGTWLVKLVNLSPGNDIRSYGAIIAIGMAATLVATMLGAPLILTPLAGTMAAASGLSLKTVLMLQVPTWMFFPLPYQLPALLVVLGIAGIGFGRCARVLSAFTLCGIVVALPLQYLWLAALGYLE